LISPEPAIDVGICATRARNRNTRIDFIFIFDKFRHALLTSTFTTFFHDEVDLPRLDGDIVSFIANEVCKNVRVLDLAVVARNR
jgi:hypothetical protein